MKSAGIEVRDEFGNIVVAANEVTKGTEKDIQAQTVVLNLLKAQADAAEKIKEIEEDKEAAARISAADKAHSEEQAGRESALSSKKTSAEIKVKIAEEAAQKEYAAGKITSEQLAAAEQAAADKRLQIERDFTEAKIALEMSSNDDAATTVSKVAALNAHLQDLELEHRAKLSNIDNEAQKRDNTAAEKLYTENENAAKEKAEAIETSLRGEEAVRKANGESIESEAQASIRLGEVKLKVAESGIKSAASSGLISKIEEQKELKKILVQEEADRQAAYARELTAAQSNAAALAAAATASKGDGDEAQKIKASSDARAKLNAMIAQNTALTGQNAAAINAADVAEKRARGDFSQWVKDMHRDLPTTAKMLQTSFQKGFDSVNAGFAKTLMTGKGFGKEMRQVGQELLQSVIEQELKKLEVYVMGLIQKKTTAVTSDAEEVAQATAKAAAMKTLAASEAGAWAFESVMSAMPYPGNMIQAPIAAGMAVAQAMAFNKGGEVPGYGSGDTVPAMLTPGETVVTKALTEQVKSNGSSRADRGGDTHVAVHVHAVDAAGFEGLIKKHSSMLQKHVTSAVRRANR
jgi:hypothetical protein